MKDSTITIVPHSRLVHSEICILADDGLLRFDRSLLMSLEIDAAMDGSKCFTAPA